MLPIKHLVPSSILSAKQQRIHHKLTALPDKTHLRHGRAGSQPKCFFLQLTQAEATWAFVRRVCFCGRFRLIASGGEAIGKGGGGYDTSGPCETPCNPNGAGHRDEAEGSWWRVNGGGGCSWVDTVVVGVAAATELDTPVVVVTG